MKEAPIIFNAAEVRAILEGSKTQHRVPVKLPKALRGGDLSNATPSLMWGVTPGVLMPMPDGTVQRLRNPWGWRETPCRTTQCRLWVRETWGRSVDGIVYRADYGNELSQGWKSPIFMPRWASRITLDVVSVGAEREGGVLVWVVEFRRVEQ